ncbi:MAG: hypothetical protein JWP69_860 [Flaviaesturariibacter sp.]|nr:hypothetical protein [Flaviaesturariibacter sp.]
MLIIGNFSLLSAQENTTPVFASYTSTDPTVLVNTSTSFAKAPIAKKAVVTKKSYFRFGEKVVSIAKHTTASDQPYVLISLHNNEYAAAEAAHKFITEQGGEYLELLNNNERNIEFSLFDKEMIVDPNHIFTPKGRWNDLAANQKKDYIISQQIGALASFIIDEIPLQKAIISLHNNVAEAASIELYKKGGALHKTVRFIYHNPEMNPNDYIITTDKEVFEKLKERKVNVVLQNYQSKDDGSLNIFCAKTKRTYIGIETQTGHTTAQENLLNVVTDILKK